MDGADEADHSEDNLGSAGSVGETRSPDSKVDDDDDASDSDGGGDVGGGPDDDDGNATSASDLGLSSPGCSLSSLASPAILPSPTTSLASPCPLTPSPATPTSAGGYGLTSVNGNGLHHDQLLSKVTSSLMSAQQQAAVAAAASASSSATTSSTSALGSLPFSLYNMLPGPSPVTSSGGVHNHHHPHHPHHPHPSHHHHSSSHHQHPLAPPGPPHHMGLGGGSHPPTSMAAAAAAAAAAGLLPQRHPIGTNPHDINNPLSVNQLTGQCSSSSSSKDKGSSVCNKAPDNTSNSHAIVSVTWIPALDFNHLSPRSLVLFLLHLLFLIDTIWCFPSSLAFRCNLKAVPIRINKAASWWRKDAHVQTSGSTGCCFICVCECSSLLPVFFFFFLSDTSTVSLSSTYACIND